MSIVPSDDGFDFGTIHADPFNLRKGENPRQKVLQQKVSAARASGRLNIAALDLKEIPVEVMKMYDFESVGAGESWAESVDLTRFVAADNELETLDDFIFPDSEPGKPEDDSQGNIFGGLETLDMHGNLLVGVPLGFRRLTHLTSLNLVRSLFVFSRVYTNIPSRQTAFRTTVSTQLLRFRHCEISSLPRIFSSVRCLPS